MEIKIFQLARETIWDFFLEKYLIANKFQITKIFREQLFV